MCTKFGNVHCWIFADCNLHKNITNDDEDCPIIHKIHKRTKQTQHNQNETNKYYTVAHTDIEHSGMQTYISCQMW